MSSSTPSPPKLFLKFFQWFCHPHLVDYIEGDLLELFYENVEEVGIRRAKWLFIWEVLLLFRPSIIRPIKSIFKSNHNHSAMLRHNFILSIRGFKRYKSSFLINLLGLSTGLTCTILIYLWVVSELNVDKFHEKDARLYQVMQNMERPDGIRTSVQTPAILAKALVNDMPEIEHAVTMGNNEFNGKGVLSVGKQSLEVDGLYASRDFFKMFSYQLTQGSAQQVLKDKSNIVLSKKLAVKLFGTHKNIIGKTVQGNRGLFNGIYKVSGIFETPPENSTEQFDFVLSYAVVFAHVEWIHKWSGDGAQTYITLKKGVDTEAFNQKIGRFLQTKPYRKNNSLFIQSYSQRYLYGQYANGQPVGGRIAYVQLFSLIAFFILLIACINFMNLSTAQATRNMKEVGVKKALGVKRWVLAFRFFQESLLLTFLSLLMAIQLVALFLPQFNLITGKNIAFAFSGPLVWALLSIVIFTGVVAGIYPAFYLSGFNPIVVLKGKNHRLNASSSMLWVRKGLVIVQFALSIIFIVGVLVINKQIAYIQNADLGYDRANVIHFKMIGPYNRSTFLSQLKNLPGVINATNTHGGSIVKMSGSGSGFQWDGQSSTKDLHFRRPHVSYDFVETLDIQLLKGRSFSRNYHSDTSKLLVNEAAAKIIGMKNIIGKTILDGQKKKQIIGVVNNFQIMSMHETLQPCIMRFSPNGSDMMVKIEPKAQNHTIGQIKKLYQSFHPEYPFSFTFLDDEHQALYVAEQRVSVLSKYFTVLAITISCLGLFGLAIFTTSQRLKEIGIRKVLGASALSITQLLTRSFTKTILLAIIIALPVSYVVVKSWLNNFAYRISLEWWYFATAGLLVLLVAWLTVSLQTFKAARINPVKCLKEE